MKRVKGISSPKPQVDYRPGKVPPPRPSPPRPAASHSGQGSWLSAGLFRVLVFGTIMVGGVAVVLWLRDMGSAAGVNWLH
jgi:hypothetical protein